MPEFTIITNFLNKQNLKGGMDPKIQSKETFENPTNPPRGIQKKKPCIKFHKDRKISKYTKNGETKCS